jgi:type VI secretion system protein ImpK
LRGDSFFGSGKAEPNTQSLPVLKRIGEALAQVKGDVQIVGHSDNQPIRSLRFPSNWHLSTARAEGVRAALAAQVPEARMRATGKAEADPVAPNDSAENRARNRRVDVILVPEKTPGMDSSVGVKK